MSEDVAQALRGCLAPWTSTGQPCAICFVLKPGAEEPLLRASLMFMVREDEEITSFPSPKELGLAQYLPLSAAALLLTTDSLFSQACDRICKQMSGQMMNLYVTENAALFLSSGSDALKAVEQYGATDVAARKLVQIAANPSASSHDRLKQMTQIAHLVDQSNSMLRAILPSKDAIEVVI